MNRSGFLLCTLLAGPAQAFPADWSWVLDWQPEVLHSDDSHSGRWLPPDHPDLQLSGRVIWTAQRKLRMIWPGTALQGRFTGRSLAVQLEDSGRTDYQVIIDGDLKKSRLLDTEAGFHVYPVAQNLEPGEHRFEIFRRTETFTGFTQVDGFFVEPGEGFLPWNEPERLRLDFYGDSQTVGACNECGDVEQWDDLRTHNHLLSYAALTSRMLKADSQIVAVSGIGLTLGYQDYTMAQIWSREAPDPEAQPYPMEARQPQAIVVNLGQNDFSRGVRDAFGPAYETFLRDLRRQHPRAWIVCVLGAMDAAHEASPFPGYLRQAVARMNDSKVVMHVFRTRSQGHPRVPEHLQMAEELVAFLKDRMALAR